MEKEQKVKISFNEKAVYVFVCWQARKKWTKFWDFSKKTRKVFSKKVAEME